MFCCNFGWQSDDKKNMENNFRRIYFKGEMAIGFLSLYPRIAARSTTDNKNHESLGLFGWPFGGDVCFMGT